MSDAPVIVIDVTIENLSEIGPQILEAIDNADFVAIDQEFSGLGDTAGRGKLEMRDYYTRLRESASTRRIISLGLSCFKLSTDHVEPQQGSCSPLHFTCLTFNILLFPDGQFKMDGCARRFLVAHGLDLNLWIEKAIGYSRHGLHGGFMTDLVKSLTLMKANLVFHNGLADLAYFYDSFWNPLPKSNEVFTADMVDMFGNRLFDTKVICKYELNWRLHSLEYCFKKSQRLNLTAGTLGKPSLSLRHLELPTDLIVRIPVELQRQHFTQKPQVGRDVCELIYNFGFCNAFKQGSCKHSIHLHQMDLVLDVEENKNKWKQDEEDESAFTWLDDLSLDDVISVLQTPDPVKRNEIVDGADSAETVVQNWTGTQESTEHSIEMTTTNGGRTNIAEKDFARYPTRGRGFSPRVIPQKLPPAQRLGSSHFTMDNSKTYNIEFGLHSAGFDAFMTGYVFGVCLTQLGRVEVDGRIQFRRPSAFVDRVHITGKSVPYWFAKSEHTKPSANHIRKMDQIRKTSPFEVQ